MIRISVEGIDGAVREFGVQGQLVERAANAAVTAVTRKAEREMEGNLSKAADIPRKPLAVYRIKRVKRVPRGTGIVWTGYNAIKAGYLGNLKQEDWGASARSYLFPGGFIARMKSGYTGIFKRGGASGKSLVDQRVNIPQAPKEASVVRAEVGPWFQDEFAKQLARRVLK